MPDASDNNPAVGIDLGTTFSVICKLDDTGRPQTLINAEGDKITPSVVFFEGADVVVGKEAVKAVATDADAVAECAKRDLGTRGNNIGRPESASRAGIRTVKVGGAARI